MIRRGLQHILGRWGRSSSSSSCSVDIPLNKLDTFNVAKYFLEEDQVRGVRADDDVAVRTKERNVTYGEIRDVSRRVSEKMVELNVRKCDRVLLCLGNSIDLIHTAFGTILSGAVLAMTVPNHPDDKFYEYMIEYTDTKLVVTTPDMYDRMKRLASSLRPDIRVMIPSEMLSEVSSILTSRETIANDMAAWFFTSGTTGPPKGCVHMQRDMAYAAHIYARTIMGVRSDDITMTTSPMTGPYAFQCNILYPFYAGASCIVNHDLSTTSCSSSSISLSDDDRFLETARQESPSIVSTTPKMIRSVLERRDEEYVREALSSLRFLVTAGDVLPEALHRKWLEKYNKTLLDGLGNSEAFAFYISNRLNDVVPGSIGTRVEGFDVDLVDETRTKISSPNEPGEIRVRGPSVSVGYWKKNHDNNNNDDNDDVFDSEGYFYTGDLATEDENGRFHLLGRVKDLVSMHTGKWRNLRVSFLELENRILSSSNSIRDCAVIEGTAFVVTENRNHDNTKSIENLLESLTGDCFDVVFLDEIPRNARDKIDRACLRARKESW
jgi:acyl-coenzyme A synthetase/AMP-(fatty) acid ligase